MLRRIAALVAIAAGAAAVGCGCTPPPSAYAGTSTWAAPMPHPPGHYPTVTVDDRTGSSWPVRAAVANWGVPVRFGSCAPGANCIHIYEVAKLPNTGGDGTTASTDMRYGARQPTVVTIRLSDAAPHSGSLGLQAVCHELGHAYGLGHDYTGGCLRPDVDGDHQVPSSQERARLVWLYR